MQTIGTPALWIGLFVIVGVLLLADIIHSYKETKAPSFKKALYQSIFWISIALAFNVFLYFHSGAQPALEFLTGYILEESLSVDNLFVFILIFSAFKIPDRLHHRILYAGILGAIFFRIIFILLGTALITKFSWILYIFGGFLVYTGVKFLVAKEEDEFDPHQSPIIRLARRFLPLSDKPHDTFWVREDGKFKFTMLFVTLLVVESSDVIFAVDSIPAVFSVTQDPFIVFSSNIFAVLGLRSIYFLIAALMDRFVYLKVALGFILAFIGIKMLIVSWVHIPIYISLGFIFLSLTTAILASFIKNKKDAKKANS